ncbi:MAG: hypothetical protein AB7F93_09885 [Immundisolibacter sp.]|uniref:hypothetical protein n=1 Tax=Immundisolibacter sp. TaxID=1934948 RepID=UPI003D0E1AEA
MDWFEKITGFREAGYDETQRQLVLRDGFLHHRSDHIRWSVGTLETPTLAQLRKRAAGHAAGRGRTRVNCVVADARSLHSEAHHAGALFQVASQFNLLEMVGPDVTPEHGITRYEGDRTQGPVCAMAAGAATIYRNYLVPMGHARGQRADGQIDCLADLGGSLGNDDGRLWTMRNGYAMCTAAGLDEIDQRLGSLDEQAVDELRAKLRIGLHWQVDVTDLPEPGRRVSQAFCSALPVAYQRYPPHQWMRFARPVLEAAYEATMLAAVINRASHGSATVFLTSLGGGAFGNQPAWIHAAMGRGLNLVREAGLDVRLVSRTRPPQELQVLADAF